MFDDEKSLSEKTTEAQDDSQIKAFVIVPVDKRDLDQNITDSDSFIDNKLAEAIGLAQAIELEVVYADSVKVSRIIPSTYMGKGQVENFNVLIEEHEPDIVIVDMNLGPGQQRNLEKAWNSKVIDRTGLILEIFGARAQTKEGKIQVELAALEYQKSRLVRSWTHLERQKGGAGFMGGPGERQIEIDRRLITDRIAKLRKELETVKRTREIQQESRKKLPFPIVSLVGYTNAGKSTLFNTLTNANVFAEDLLFATLDPTMRKVSLENGIDMILSDTVGFISDLPTHLIAAFRATLEHVQQADVILHVRDISNPAHEEQKANVISIMKDLGIEYEEDKRIVEVLNKIDLLDADERGDAQKTTNAEPNYVAVSAVKSEGLDELLEIISRILTQDHKTVNLDIPHADGKALAWLHEYTDIIDTNVNDNITAVAVRISPADLGRFVDKFDIKPYQ